MRENSFLSRTTVLCFVFMLLGTLSFPMKAESTSSSEPKFPCDSIKYQEIKLFMKYESEDRFQPGSQFEKHYVVVTWRYKSHDGRNWQPVTEILMKSSQVGTVQSDNTYSVLKTKGCIAYVEASVTVGYTPPPDPEKIQVTRYLSTKSTRVADSGSGGYWQFLKCTVHIKLPAAKDRVNSTMACDYIWH